MSQFDRINDEIRSVRAALSLYVGGALPPDLEGTADANGLPTGGWVFSPSAPVAGRFEALAADLVALDDRPDAGERTVDHHAAWRPARPRGKSRRLDRS